MRRNREQRLGIFPHRRQKEILDVLARQDERGILFPYPLHRVADIFDGRHIREEQIQFVHRRRSVSLAQQSVRHI